MDNVVKVPLVGNKVPKHSCPVPASVIFKPSASRRTKLPKMHTSFDTAAGLMMHENKAIQSKIQQDSGTKPNTFNYNIPCVQTLGQKPSTLICPACYNKVVTRVRYKCNMRTHFLAALLCISFCFVLAPLAYMVKSCKSVEHYCPICKAYIGSY